jgi:uncharacterized membrane-anchored protein
MTDEPAKSAQLLTAHPLRASVLGEVHARPFHPVGTPLRILHFGFSTNAAQAAEAQRALVAYCKERGVEAPHEGVKHFRVSLGGAVLRWESHAEFSTYTWEFPALGRAAFDPPSASLASVMAGLPQPGPHLISVDLHLIEGAEPIGLEDIFDSASLTSAKVDGGGAMVATDFRADPGGFVRILLRDCGLTPSRAGALVQRLLEIETYRLLALLGLPEAQQLLPRVQSIETRVSEVASQMTRSSGLEGDHELLDVLTSLLADLEAQSASWMFRIGATRAYEKLVQQRLVAIGEEAHDGWPTIGAFLSRRMAPAMRTVEMLETRQSELARKLVRAANLLRTRVDVEIEQQNRDLLRSMNERTRMQLRLQQTVEGLSVAAITYYTVGLASYVIKGLKDAAFISVDPSLATAAVVPIVLLGVAFVLRRIREGALKDHS